MWCQDVHFLFLDLGHAKMDDVNSQHSPMRTFFEQETLFVTGVTGTFCPNIIRTPFRNLIHLAYYSFVNIVASLVTYFIQVSWVRYCCTSSFPRVPTSENNRFMFSFVVRKNFLLKSDLKRMSWKIVSCLEGYWRVTPLSVPK